MRFRKKPVVIDAVRFTGTNLDEIAEFLGEVPPHRILETDMKYNYVAIVTLEGKMFALAGDWIIKGVKGEFYPCKPDIFEATYESVDYADEVHSSK